MYKYKRQTNREIEKDIKAQQSSTINSRIQSLFCTNVDDDEIFAMLTGTGTVQEVGASEWICENDIDDNNDNSRFTDSQTF